MKKYYEFIEITKEGFRHFERSKFSSSVDYWLKVAKKEEKNGCYVTMEFDYYSDIGEVCMIKYSSYNRKTGKRETYHLIRNKEKLQRLNKK